MEQSRQEYWSGLPFPPPGDLPDPGTEPKPPVAPALAGGFFTTEPRGEGERGANWEGRIDTPTGPCVNQWLAVLVMTWGWDWGQGQGEGGVGLKRDGI